MNKLTLLAALAVFAPAPIRAQSVSDDIKGVIEHLDSDPSDSALRRAQVMRTALALGDQLKYATAGNGECLVDGSRIYDCSGYVAAVVRTTVDLPRASADGMYRRAKLGGALGTTGPRPGDILFFRDSKDRSLVGHTAIYLGADRFVHMSGRAGTPVSVISLSDFASRRGATAKETWRDRMTAYADLDALPARPAGAFEAERVASRGSVEVRSGPSEPGGVYISPELVYRAMKTDKSGVLDALERLIVAAHFDVDPVQEIDIEIPPGFDGADR